MLSIEQRTIKLSKFEASFVDTMISTGLFTSPSEVVQAGLQALMQRWAHDQMKLAKAIVSGIAAADAGQVEDLATVCDALCAEIEALPDGATL